jgi:hypothetical protein
MSEYIMYDMQKWKYDFEYKLQWNIIEVRRLIVCLLKVNNAVR